MAKTIKHGTCSGYTGGCRCGPCKAAHRDYHRAYYLANEHNIRRNNRHNMLKRRYNLTREGFDALLERQGGACGVCKEPLDLGTPRSISVDHNQACCPGRRSCGKCVRGLLHNACNSMLGLAKDNPLKLESGARYLEIHSTTGFKNAPREEVSETR